MEEKTKAAGNALMRTIVELADFLNTEAGFAISEPEIRSCILVYLESGLDIASETESACIFRTAFCKDRQQYQNFLKYFRQFLRQQALRRQNARQFEALERQKSNLYAMQKQMARSQDAAQREIEEILARKEAALSGIRQSEIEDRPVSDQYQEKLQKLCKNQQFENPALQKLAAGGKLTPADLTEETITRARQEIMKRAEAAMLSGDARGFRAMKQILDAMTSLQEAACSQLTVLQKKMQDVEKKYEQEQKKIQSGLKKQEAEIQKVQQEIDRIAGDLQEMAPASWKLTIKSGSSVHRSAFQNTGGSVQLYRDSQEPACAGKLFDQLSDAERQEIREYLKQNILRFQTRLTRHLDEMDHSAIDIGETVRNACRTGGIPMLLHYRKPKPGKTDLMLVLDVSGSCKEASEMMLTFMYMLRTAFPQGCSAFAFVNSLYDISKLMDVRDNIDNAISQVMQTIPTRGVYSDYSRPIRTLKRDYSAKITKNTILIFMGDARNNRNEPCYAELKFLCRKAKRAYWLNTETRDLWGQGDSVAPGYAQCTAMLEAINVAELTAFIRDGIR